MLTALPSRRALSVASLVFGGRRAFLSSSAAGPSNEEPVSAVEPELLSSSSSTSDQKLSAEEHWKRRLPLREPVLQRFQKLAVKAYHAPDWELDKDTTEKVHYYPAPLRGYGTTPDKWNFYNKVVWPPGYVVPETGLPKPREVFHCREGVHMHLRKIFSAFCLARRLPVDDAIEQLDFQQTKYAHIVRDVLKDARKRAAEEFHIEHPGEMNVAEIFGIQTHILKGARRHAHEMWCTIRYRYINIFVRLEESPAPGFSGRWNRPDGWKKMDDYYAYLRGRKHIGLP